MNLLAKYIHIYICRIFFYFSNACSTRRREMDVKPMSRFNLLDITAVSIEYRRGCVTNTGWSRKWLRRYIYIRFQWTTGCIEEEIVIASDRSDRKLVCIASCASCVGETEWQWTISAFEDSLSPSSSSAKSRQRFFFPPPIRWVLFFFLFQIRNKGRNEVIKKRLYPWDIKVRSKWESVYSDCNIILFFLFLLKILRYSGAEIY